MYLLEAYLLNRPKIKKSPTEKSELSTFKTNKLPQANGVLDKRLSNINSLTNKTILKPMPYTELDDHYTSHPISCLVRQINRHHKAMNKKSRVKTTTKSISLSA